MPQGISYTRYIVGATVFLLASFFYGHHASAGIITPVRLELSGNPGETIYSSVKITNDGTAPILYYTQFQNFEAQDETGNPKFVNTREGLAVWAHTQPTVSIVPHDTQEVPFQIQIPRNAEPGGYFAAIFLRTTPPAPSGGSEVALGGRLGTLLLLRVNGNIKEGVDILEFGTTNGQKVFTALPVNFYYRFQNTGNDRVNPAGEIRITNTFGALTKVLNANLLDGNVLPKSIRRFESAWITSGGPPAQDPTAEAPTRANSFFGAVRYEWHNFALGRYTATLSLTFGTVQERQAQAKVVFYVLPWQLLITIILGLIILIIILRFIIRRYNRLILKRAGKR